MYASKSRNSIAGLNRQCSLPFPSSLFASSSQLPIIISSSRSSSGPHGAVARTREAGGGCFRAGEKYAACSLPSSRPFTRFLHSFAPRCSAAAATSPITSAQQPQPQQQKQRGREDAKTKTGATGSEMAAASSFSSLGVTSPSLLSRLSHTLHYSYAAPIQSLAIPAILRGESVVIGAETGCGKTMAYLLPIVQRLIDTTPLYDPATAATSSYSPSSYSSPTAASLPPHSTSSSSSALTPARLQHLDRRYPRVIIFQPNRELIHQCLHVLESLIGPSGAPIPVQVQEETGRNGKKGGKGGKNTNQSIRIYYGTLWGTQTFPLSHSPQLDILITTPACLSFNLPLHSLLKDQSKRMKYEVEQQRKEGFAASSSEDPRSSNKHLLSPSSSPSSSPRFNLVDFIQSNEIIIMDEIDFILDGDMGKETKRWIEEVWRKRASRGKKEAGKRMHEENFADVEEQDPYTTTSSSPNQLHFPVVNPTLLVPVSPSSSSSSASTPPVHHRQFIFVGATLANISPLSCFQFLLSTFNKNTSNCNKKKQHRFKYAKFEQKPGPVDIQPFVAEPNEQNQENPSNEDATTSSFSSPASSLRVILSSGFHHLSPLLLHENNIVQWVKIGSAAAESTGATSEQGVAEPQEAAVVADGSDAISDAAVSSSPVSSASSSLASIPPSSSSVSSVPLLDLARLANLDSGVKRRKKKTKSPHDSQIPDEDEVFVENDQHEEGDARDAVSDLDQVPDLSRLEARIRASQGKGGFRNLVTSKNKKNNKQGRGDTFFKSKRNFRPLYEDDFASGGGGEKDDGDGKKEVAQVFSDPDDLEKLAHTIAFINACTPPAVESVPSLPPAHAAAAAGRSPSSASPIATVFDANDHPPRKSLLFVSTVARLKILLSSLQALQSRQVPFNPHQFAPATQNNTGAAGDATGPLYTYLTPHVQFIPYHADLKPLDRHHTLNDFNSDLPLPKSSLITHQILICTSLASRGLDFDKIMPPPSPLNQVIPITRNAKSTIATASSSAQPPSPSSSSVRAGFTSLIQFDFATNVVDYIHRVGRMFRLRSASAPAAAARAVNGKVPDPEAAGSDAATATVAKVLNFYTKKDEILAHQIRLALASGQTQATKVPDPDEVIEEQELDEEVVEDESAVSAAAPEGETPTNVSSSSVPPTASASVSSPGLMPDHLFSRNRGLRNRLKKQARREQQQQQQEGGQYQSSEAEVEEEVEEQGARNNAA